MLQGTGHPAEIQEFYSRFSAGCPNLFFVAKSVRLVMDTIKFTCCSIFYSCHVNVWDSKSRGIPVAVVTKQN